MTIWSANSFQLEVPRTRLVTVGDRTFSAAGSRLWNSLPRDVTECQTLDDFRRKLKHFPFFPWTLIVCLFVCFTWTLRFLPRCIKCRRGLAMRILSVRLSVCLSVCHTRDPWQNERKIGPDFYTIRKNNYPSFLRRRMVGWGDPFYVKFWVYRPPLERNRWLSTNNRSYLLSRNT